MLFSWCNNISVLFMCLLFIFQSFFTPALGGSNETDMQALLAFKAAIFSDPHNALSSWNGTVHFCSWRGVICGRKHRDRVVSINILSQGLVGSLSPYVGNLSFLKSINLVNNSFGGQIPQEIGRLRRLKFLEFSRNSFSGEIPRNLSLCQNLKVLALINNDLTGGIIPEISSLTKLEFLGLSLNRFVGSIPPWIGNLTSLEEFPLANCGLEGPIPEEIGRLRRLKFIQFSNNSITGEIPRNLSQCINLSYLDLMNNRLVGKIVPEIGSLMKLQSLELSQNNLSGTIPPSIGNLTSLTHLRLYFGKLEGQIPDSLSQLQNLRQLVLFENRLSGNIPAKLFNSSSIAILHLGFNQLQGRIPLDIGHTLSNIKFLSLQHNFFTGEIPTSLLNTSLESIFLSSNQLRGPMLWNLGRLTNLSVLLLSNNSIHGDVSFISSLTNCTNLRFLGLGRNLLNGTLPNSIANLSQKLTLLILCENNLHGRLPSGIGYLVNLVHLILYSCHFSGSIPPSIGKLVNIEQLLLQSNRFTGVIPSSLGNLTLLSNLELEYNNISGTIPSSFNNLHNLIVLDLTHNNLNGPLPPAVLSLSTIPIYIGLSYNAFSGPIPQEVGLLKNLGYLDLSNNQLSGSIPNAMSTCVNLERLHLEGNSFEGEIPVGLSALRGLQDLDLSRNQLSGSIPRFLAELSLSNLNLSFNNLSGEVPALGVFLNKSAISVDGNVDLCGGIHELGLQSCQILNHKNGNAAKLLKIIVPTVTLGVLFSVIVVSVGVLIHKRKTQGKNAVSGHSFVEKFMTISYAGLLKSTNGFSNDNLIGVGRFGSVYKASLDNGKTIAAVKVLNLDVRGASTTFIAECNALKLVLHRNLVKVLSVCVSIDFQGHDFKALVYDYKSNGSLEEWLHQNDNEDDENGLQNLTMIQRLNLAIDIASALEYLHFGLNSTIIHGDLKPSNILLDDEMVAHVGDFGLAKVVLSMSKDFPNNESNSIAIKGTIGYIAPEYGMGNTVSTQGDAYSFGILLLEMFTGIRPTDEAFEDGHFNLHSSVSFALSENVIDDILDPFIIQEIRVNDDNKAIESMVSVLKIGVTCSSEFPWDRMTMKDVVAELSKIRTALLAEA